MRKWVIRNKHLSLVRFLVVMPAFLLFFLTGASCGKFNLFKKADQVQVTGFEQVITSDTIWKKSKSPYYIENNIFIADDATLTIQPGVRVYLAPGVLIMSQGCIIAQGKKDSPIYFKSMSEKAWDHIECYGGRYEKNGELPVNIFHYCVVEGGGGIAVRASAVDIMGCKFYSNVASPLRAEFSSGKIIENEIYNNTTQRDSSSGNGAGIMVYTDKNMLIADNVVHDNFSSGGRDGGGGIYAYACDVGNISILRNIIYGNLSDRNGGGIFAYACRIEDNQVRYNSTSDSGGGIYAVRSELINNKVRQNQARRGGGIYADNSHIEYNLVLENTARTGMGGGLFYEGGDQIINNTFIKNGARNLKGDTVVISGNPHITRNNIICEYGYALRVQNSNLAKDLDASGNYWGTADEQTVSEIIYDWLDDSDVGLVDCGDFSENWINQAPIAPYSWVAPQPPDERPPNELYGRIDRNRILGRFDRLSFDVTGNVLIPEGITLQILPGTRLTVSPDINIRVRGRLMLEGDKDHPVYITGDPAMPWGNLLFETPPAIEKESSGKKTLQVSDDGERGLLSFCVIENGLGVIMEGTGPQISDSIVRHNYGSGIKVHNAGVTISNCQIIENMSTADGGGVYIYTDQPVNIDSNAILKNYAEANGGGVCVSSEQGDTPVNITGNRIEANRSQKDGGGVWATGAAIVNNKIFSNTSKARGGGLFLTSARVEGNHIATNQAAQGGGIFTENSGAFTGNRIEKNSATETNGGGVCFNFNGVNNDKAIFQRNMVIDNSSAGEIPVGGIYLMGSLTFAENNIFKNKGIQLYNANPSNTPALAAVNCYWGVGKSAEIEKLIFDNRNNPNLSSIVFEPFVNQPIDINLPENPN